MFIVRALLKGVPEAATPVAQGTHLIHDLLWAHAAPADGLEHITVRPAPCGMVAVFFLTAASDEAALQRVRGLVVRTRDPIAAQGYTAEIPA
ncbi:hypothetical protein ACFYU9_22240 [Streptomyces sp. NPDC004327]|uniref:hypothetical protein n=1 Tax=unclassified Streptomyces TaxID=2593676 RepID=UPI00368D35AF